MVTRKCLWRFLLGSLALIIGLSACGGKAVRKRISEPSVSIQELRLNDNPSASVVLRINNFSTVPMRFVSAQLRLQLMDLAAIDLPQAIDLEVPGEAADVVRLSVPMDSIGIERLRSIGANGNLSYSLKGEIRSENPNRSYDIEYLSRLTTVPGTTGVFR